MFRPGPPWVFTKRFHIDVRVEQGVMPAVASAYFVRPAA